METKDSPYYMGNRECLPTILSLKTTDHVINIETHWDCNMEDLCDAFFAACVGATYLPTTVLESMYEFAKDKLQVEDPEYYKEEIEDNE